MTHKVAMRRRSPRRACRSHGSRRCATLSERHRAADEVGLPGGAEAGGLGRPARDLPRRVGGRDRGAPARGALGVADAGGDPRAVRRGNRDERDRDRPRRRGVDADAVRPPAAAGNRLRRRLDPRLPGDDLRRPARGVRADRGADRAHARPRERDRLPAADRLARRRGSSWSSAQRGSRAARWPISCAMRSGST